MIWLLLSGYFIIAGLYYHFVGPSAIPEVTSTTTEQEKQWIKKYGNRVVLFLSAIWPIMTVLSILVFIAILIKR